MPDKPRAHLANGDVDHCVHDLLPAACATCCPRSAPPQAQRQRSPARDQRPVFRPLCGRDCGAFRYELLLAEQSALLKRACERNARLLRALERAGIKEELLPEITEEDGDD